jgi:hypothetical protein
MVNTAFKKALSNIVSGLAEPKMFTLGEQWYEAIARDWFSKPKTRKEILQLLAEFRLDEFAIEAEAIRCVLPELEVLDRMLTLESRRNKALRSIAEYRNDFAKRVREVSNRVIGADPVIQLENQAVRRSA